MKPYNDFWLDCVANNLMAILIHENESFNSLPINFKAQYWKKIKNQSFSSHETFLSLQKQGLFIPKVIYNNDELYSFFNINKLIIEPNNHNNVHSLIKEALSRGQFIFVQMDRFFYKSGRESGKIHLVHPTFIYDCDDDERNYIGFEDCISPGKMHPYKIPFDVIDLSIQHFRENNKNIELQTFSLKTEMLENYHFNLSNHREIIDQYCINNVIYHQEFDLYYQVGISSLYEYAEEMEELLLNLTEPGIFLLRMNSFIHNHKRNKLLINFLYSNKKIAKNIFNEIMDNLNALTISWTIHKNFSLKRLQTNNKDNSIELKNNLSNIIGLEEKFCDLLMKT
ncbi:hypothetical protein [Paenibacillus humicus]|uniref:hypothetical protein n=1 Tax=Paenibacillus humicus TaxID=412861 RepID=UPI003D2D76B0